MGWESSYEKASRALSSHHKLQSLHNKSQLTSRNHDDDLQQEYSRDPLRPEILHYNANISTHQTSTMPKRMLSNGSGDSRDPIIRKDVDFTVSSESAV